MAPDIKSEISSRAEAEGFGVVGFAGTTVTADQSAGLDAHIHNGFHGDMAWMAQTQKRRSAPTAMWSQAKSAIVLGLNYGPDFNPMSRLHNKSQGVISVYAQGHDYHGLIKKKLKRIARWLAQNHNCQVKIFVDTAPLMEKPLAQQGAIGWQGKHTNLVSREFGSWLFLGTILTDLEIAPTLPETDHCGSCRACLDICPTGAFPAPHQIDARRCISYLTIEHNGHIGLEFRKKMGNRIYGCDDCLAVCPWNKFAQTCREAKLVARAELIAPSLLELSGLDDGAFRALFQASPVKRIGRDKFIRNVLIAIGNSQDKCLADRAISLLKDPSPLVRAMAIWALFQLLETGEMIALRNIHYEQEKDPAVRAEWEVGA